MPDKQKKSLMTSHTAVNSVATEHVVVVDDDIVTRYLIGSALRENNINTHECDSAEALFQLLEKQQVDVIILDLILPKVNGLDTLTFLRQDSDVGVIMISSRANPSNRLTGLREGADDFLSKPVDTQELIFKVKSLAARVHKQRGLISHVIVEVGNCEIRLNNNALFHEKSNKTCRLTESEQRLLVLLAQHSEQTCSRKVLHQCINHAELSTSNTRSIDTLISRIRQKLNDVSCTKEIISIRGQGYRLVDKTEVC